MRRNVAIMANACHCLPCFCAYWLADAQLRQMEPRGLGCKNRVGWGKDWANARIPEVSIGSTSWLCFAWQMGLAIDVMAFARRHQVPWCHEATLPAWCPYPNTVFLPTGAGPKTDCFSQKLIGSLDVLCCKSFGPPPPNFVKTSRQ